MLNDDKSKASAADVEMNRVIAKIQKLLLKTKDNGVSEAEADSAANVIQKLMSQYNLDMAAVEAAQGPSATVVERTKEELKGKARFKWQRRLAKYTAEANFCYYMVKAEVKYIEAKNPSPYDSQTIVRAHTTYSNVFVGRKANVISAQMLYAYLTETIEASVPLMDTKDRFSRSAVSWKEGCADRLCERLAQRREDLIAEHDAKVKAEQEALRAAAEKRYAEEQAKVAKQLEPNEGAEVDAKLSDIAARAHDRVNPDVTPTEADRPDIDAGDDWNPADAEESPREETGTAMVLASEYDQNERDANEEVAHGWEPGSIARWRREEAEQEAAEAEEAAKRELEDVEKPVREETERQRRARERREEKEYEAQERRLRREERTEENAAARDWAKKDHTAYRAGAEKGKSIGLDPQLAAPRDAKKLGDGKGERES